ncbi:nucleoid-associated protein [Virgibacillus halodenitrificans]|uniref:Nucleoid-associated protein n=1 Tax=Virgibacillus halodenitrificans TaxID=1482 RepID=A0ABR7VN25_VIRHA|nr:nucleoid-associated protein [Virgibacillus halodenitrificans]MBD1223305.1 nucleoid-associated protein [Virgibacillus halodenitrificans]
MTTATLSGMTIKRMAINLIDLEESDAKTSIELFPLKNSSEVIDEFFRTHFLETRHGKNTKSCRFFDEDATVKTKIERFAENNSDETFLKLSEELTDNLFKIMKNSSSTSNGTFFVFEVSTEEEDCIFLIKLDPKHGVQVDYTDLTVKVLENILPDSNDRVHKCAIIRYNSRDDVNADLFVMDKQQKEGEPARFFIETFLQAEEILNDKIITRTVIKEAKEKITDLLPEVDQSEIYNSIDKVFSNGSHIELQKAISDVLKTHVPEEKTDRELYINSNSEKFVSDYLTKYRDHQTSFTAERKDNIIVYKGEKDQLYLRYNKGITSKISFNKDQNGNDVITIDKSLNLKMTLK